MKIATWNVNSLKVRLPQVLEWLAVVRPDVLALQETKLTDDAFPADRITAAGYQVLYSGQKTYNGVAIISRLPGQDVVKDLPGIDDPQRRVLAATFADVRVVNVYIPNGEAVESEKYGYKLRWLEALTEFLAAELARHEKLVLLGDFNIAPEDRDVYDPAAWEGKVLFSAPEKAAFHRLLALGLTDTLRQHTQEAGIYTWWDYRMFAFRRKLGLRIDHILASRPLAERCSRCQVDIEPRKAERPSDHAPVVAEFA